MLNKVAFANSLAVLTAALYVVFAILELVAPRVFQVCSMPSSSVRM
jgi:hypothetical protein